METTESDVGYPEEQPPEVDDTPAEGTPQRDDKGSGRKPDNDDGKATGNPNDELDRSLSASTREVVARCGAVAERAGDEALDEPRRPVDRRRAHRGDAVPSSPHIPDGARASVSPSV